MNMARFVALPIAACATKGFELRLCEARASTDHVIMRQHSQDYIELPTRVTRSVWIQDLGKSQELHKLKHAHDSRKTKPSAHY